MKIVDSKTTKSLMGTTLKQATGSPLLKKFNINGALTQLVSNKPKQVIKSLTNAAVSTGTFKFNQLTTAALQGKLTPKKIQSIIFGTNSSNIQNVFNKNANIASFSCGYAGDTESLVPGNQLIILSSTSEKIYGTITGILQKEFILSAKSNWEPFIPSVGKSTELVSQLVIGKSLSNPVSSRRIWAGTTPIKLSLELYFVAIKDAKKEVEEPCNRLQRMILPSFSKGIIPLLTPPGPHPVFAEQGDQISIRIGNMLNLNQVIISEVTVRKDNKLDKDGRCLSAVVNLEIETYEILTKEAFSQAVGLEPINPTIASIEGNKKATKQVTPIGQA
jgi:hypothetical protein